MNYKLKKILTTVLGIILIILALIFPVIFICYTWSPDKSMDSLLGKIAATNILVIIPVGITWIALSDKFK